MKGINKKRLAVICAGVGAVAAAGALTFGGTNALFTSQAGSQTDSVTAGTVNLTVDTAATHSYQVTGLMPGDGSCYSSLDSNISDPGYYTCDEPRDTYALDYSGADAFVGLNFTVTSVAAQDCAQYSGGAASISPADLVANCTGPGELPLFNGNSGSGDFDLGITPENGDTAHQLLLDSNVVGAAKCSADTNGLATCTSEIDNVMMPVAYGSAPNSGLQWTDGSKDYVQVDYNLPRSAGNQYQGSSVTFTLVSHAVQWANNNTTKGSTSPACDSATTFPSGLSGSVPCPISWS